jgi:hypothetical protein
LIPTKEGEHAICWFLHDPLALCEAGRHHQLPAQWIEHALLGLQNANPFIHELENLAVSAAISGDNELCLQLDELV